MLKIEFTDREGAVHTVHTEGNCVLMEVLRQHPSGVAAICGGSLACGTCHVYLEEKAERLFPPASGAELAMVDTLEHKHPNSRLSCQLYLKPGISNLQLTIAPEA